VEAPVRPNMQNKPKFASDCSNEHNMFPWMPCASVSIKRFVRFFVEKFIFYAESFYVTINTFYQSRSPNFVYVCLGL